MPNQNPDRAAEGLSDEKRTTIAAARKIADIIFGYATTITGNPDQSKPWMADRRNGGVNPRNQTRSGLFLEFYYGQPCSLWTPLGKYDFGGDGSGHWEPFLPEILSRLNATLHRELQRDSMGEHGPIYAIHKIDGQPLPEPIECPRAEYIEYEQAKKEWKELTPNEA